MKTIFVMLVLLSSLAQAQMRTWTNASGKKIVAEITKATDETVTLTLKRNKKSYELKRAEFSDSDQEFIKKWLEDEATRLKEEAEQLEKKKEEMFMMGDTKLIPEKYHQLTMQIDKTKYKNVEKDSYSMGIVVPKGFDPINKVYTIVHVSVAGKGQPSKALGSYMDLVRKADCILIAADNIAFGTDLPTIDLYNTIHSKWNAKEKKWPRAFFGFSGGAKSSAYKMAHAAQWELNIIGAYMTGCNEDRTTDAIERRRLKSKQKKLYKSCSIWLSSGDSDKIATPAQHVAVMKSMKSNRIKNVKIHTFKGGHIIPKEDQVEAIQWMRANAAKRK